MGASFRWQLASAGVAQVGDGIALAAGPLLVAALTRNPALIAAAAVVQNVPTLVLGLYAGAIADRVDRRRMVILANVARLVIIAVLVTAIATDILSIGLLLALLLAVGTAEVFADSGWRTILPMVVPSADLGIGNARLTSTFLVGNQLIGPAVGALLFAVAHALPFTVQGASVLLAIALFAKVRLPARAAPLEERRHVGHDIVEGVRWIWRSAPVRTLTLLILIFNVTWGAPWGVLVYWAQERLGASDVGFGMLTTAAAVGGIAAVVGYDWLEARVSLARLMRVCLSLEVLMHLALAVTTSLALALAVMVVFGAYAFVWAALSSAVRQRATPMDLQGRVGSVYWVGLVAGLMVGQALGGVIASHWGPAAPFWFAFLGSGLTLALLWRQLDAVAHAGEPGTD